jgi:glyoxylase-like metal-dependent hydrolase (beta-lactamase superfamily II)
VIRAAIAAAALLFGAGGAQAQAAPVSITRLDCGTLRINDAASFSDTHAHDGKKLDMPVSCYLIRHGEEYLLWDAGLSASLLGVPLSKTEAISATVTTSILDQLKGLKVDPAQVKRVVASHFHLDHVGQVGSFPDATLLIGEADWTALQKGTDLPPTADAPALAHWLKEGGKVETIARDKDVFGDGSIVILDMPGHSPGHKCLLVRLAEMGPVLLTGDLYHLQANYDTNGMPMGNWSRADTLASMDRFKALARNLDAKIIIGHEPADLGKLPAFPESAR